MQKDKTAENSALLTKTTTGSRHSTHTDDLRDESFLRQIPRPAALPEEPSIKDVLSSFEMLPERAEIWFGGRRKVLMDQNDLGILRRELIQSLGVEKTRSIMTRIGYELGQIEAELALQMRSDASMFEIFTAGPQFHSIKGAVLVEPQTFECDPKTGDFYSEYYWHNSSECAAHLSHVGVGTDPAGWQQVGYASGFSSAILGRPMVFREIRCVAMGHDTCFLVGQNAERWEDSDKELRWFRADNYMHRPNSDETKSDAKGTENNTAPIPEDLKPGQRSIVGASAGFNITLHMVDQVAPTDATVLFLGESGVGKEVFARELHKRSKRAKKEMLSVNCAATPEALLDAELFGAEKDVYNASTPARPGWFERADGSTLFLDEIGLLSFSAQGKLLRVLQEGEFERVGGTRTRYTDVRIIAATNTDLQESIKKGLFREDLYFRLNVFPIHIPSLRSRKADIPLLVSYFLRLYSQKHNLPPKFFDGEALRFMMSYDWPGNIRELENIVERSVILSGGSSEVQLSHLMMTASQYRDKADDPFRDFVIKQSGNISQDSVTEMLMDSGLKPDDIIDRMIDSALIKTKGNASAAARMLGLTRAQINYRLKQRKKK